MVSMFMLQCVQHLCAAVLQLRMRTWQCLIAASPACSSRKVQYEHSSSSPKGNTCVCHSLLVLRGLVPLWPNPVVQPPITIPHPQPSLCILPPLQKPLCYLFPSCSAYLHTAYWNVLVYVRGWKQALPKIPDSLWGSYSLIWRTSRMTEPRRSGLCGLSGKLLDWEGNIIVAGWGRACI